MATEHSNNIRNNSNIAAVRSYSFIKPGSNKVVVSVKNLTSKDSDIKAGTVIGKIEAANAVPPMLAPKPENYGRPKERCGFECEFKPQKGCQTRDKQQLFCI